MKRASKYIPQVFVRQPFVQIVSCVLCLSHPKSKGFRGRGCPCRSKFGGGEGSAGPEVQPRSSGRCGQEHFCLVVTAGAWQLNLRACRSRLDRLDDSLSPADQRRCSQREGRWSVVGRRRSSVVSRRSSFVGGPSVICRRRPPTTDSRRPPTAERRRPTTDDRRSTNDERRSTTDRRRPPMGDRRPTTYNRRRPTIDHRAPTTGDRQRPTMRDDACQRTTDDRQPMTRPTITHDPRTANNA